MNTMKKQRFIGPVMAINNENKEMKTLSVSEANGKCWPRSAQPTVGKILLTALIIFMFLGGAASAQGIISDIVNPLIMIIVIIVIIALVIIFISVVKIRDNEVGIKTRKLWGDAMPQGQIIAREDKQIGILADTLMPGLYLFNPIVWKIEKDPITKVDSDKIGVVEAIDGEPISPGRLLGDAVDCNNFQNAKAFLTNHGMKGPQIAILKPGEYRINTKVFKIIMMDATSIPEEKIGQVIALDGKGLPSGYIIAPRPENEKHNSFSDGQEFINAGGYRGPQLDTLQPGKYYINPLLFKVELEDISEVPPGYVAVIRSNVGSELEKESGLPGSIDRQPSFSQEVHEKEEVVLSTNKFKRGIWQEPIAPGKYNLNKLAFTAYLVPTSAVTIDWAADTRRADSTGMIEKEVGKIASRNKDVEQRSKGIPKEDRDKVESEKAVEFFKFSQLTLTSKDGFKLEADVRMIIRVRPQHAAFVIARFGSVPNLIEQIVHPLIDSSFRNNAGEKKAIDFIQSRTQLQKDAIEKAKDEFDKYYVEAQNLLISYIDVDEKLLDTQTKKEIALQQQEQYQQEAKAQEEYINFKEKEARASKQKEVIDAKLGIDIAKDDAESARMEAEGERDSIKYKADGEAYKAREIGKATADAYRVQSDAIGSGNLALIKVIQEISEGKVKITPDMLITTGGDGQGSGLLNAWLATMLAGQMENKLKRIEGGEVKDEETKEVKDTEVKANKPEDKGLHKIVDKTIKIEKEKKY